MIGTIVNTCTIIVGSIVGAAMNRGIKEKYKDTLYTGLGLACLGIGLNAVISNCLKSISWLMEPICRVTTLKLFP